MSRMTQLSGGRGTTDEMTDSQAAVLSTFDPLDADDDAVEGQTNLKPPLIPARHALPPRMQREEAAVIDSGSAESAVLDERALRELDRDRRAAAAIASDPHLALTLLSFIQTRGRARVEDLVTYGTPNEVFGLVFDLYDAELLARDGATVHTAARGRQVLNRAGLLK